MKFPWSKRATSTVTTQTSSLSWQIPPRRPMNYENFANEGLMRNEIVYACVSEICSSAAEPRVAAYKGKQKLERHDVIDLLNQPNPFMSRYTLVSSMWLHRSLGGNAFLEKVYSNGGSLAQLWPIRPDRVEVIRDPKKFIGGYKVGWGNDTIEYPTNEIIHSKNFSPYDNYYGVAPVQVLASRVDTDNFMREFTKAFFFNAAVPAGLINIKGSLEAEDKEMVRQRNRAQFTGPYGWHSDMIIEGTEATYTPMGMPLGARGIAYPELDEINEARICSVFGVPLSLVESRLSQSKGGYARKTEDRKSFWEETLMPMYRDLAETLTNSLIDDFDGFDRLEFDLSTVLALQDDADKLAIRIRANAAAGLIYRDEARVALGLNPIDNGDKVWIHASNILTQGPNEVPGPTDNYPALPPKNPSDSDLVDGPSRHVLQLPEGVNIWIAKR